MSRTLLYTVQRVLEKLDLDSVTTINESSDSIAIATEAESTLFSLISRDSFPQRFDLLELETTSATNIDGESIPQTALLIPDNYLRINSLRYEEGIPVFAPGICSYSCEYDAYSNPYNCGYYDEIGDPCVPGAGDPQPEPATGTTIDVIKYLPPEEFLDRMYKRDKEDSSVTYSVYKSIPLYLINNLSPKYYTSFDNKYVVMDSWDSAVESRVTGEGSICVGSALPTWDTNPADTFIIPIDEVTYPLYLAELSAACSVYLNGVQNPEDEKRRQEGSEGVEKKADRVIAVRKRRELRGRREELIQLRAEQEGVRNG